MAESTPEKQPWPQRVAATIDTLIGAPRITWGNQGDWRKSRVVALERLSLPHVMDESLPPMVVEKGDTAWLDPEQDLKASEYVVLHGSYAEQVPARSVQVCEPRWLVPDHKTAPIMLMCFELFPYAAVHGGHMKAATFFTGIVSRSVTKAVDGSESWASFLGAGMTKTLQPVNLRATFGRGDIVVFYNKAGWAFHTVIADGATSPGGEPMVYSIADGKQDHPVRWTLAAVAADLATAGEWGTVTHVRVFTPRDPAAQ